MTESLKVTSQVEPLTAQQEVVLKQFYAYLLKSWGYSIPLTLKEISDAKSFVASDKKLISAKDRATPQITVSSNTQETYNQARTHLTYLDQSTAEPVKPKKGSHHHHKNGDKNLTHSHLQHYNPDELHVSFINLARSDSPDTSALRFVVARKYNPNDAVAMIGKCLDWRQNSHPVNDWVLGGDAEIYWDKKHPEMVDAFKLNQAYIRGHDKEKRPIVAIAVKKHLRQNCPDHDFERLICLVIEWIRLQGKAFEEGTTKGCILFDMTGFGMKNADLAAVHFLAIMFEANYPECLGMIWIHNAPWIFNAVWKIIKGWLDPVVASKIRFTKKAKDLEEFIDPQFIPKDLGGKDDYKPVFIAPTKENAGVLPKDEKFVEIAKERDQTFVSFIEATIQWILSKEAAESADWERVRAQTQIDLARNYLKLDPYIRNKSAFERSGEMKVNGF